MTVTTTAADLAAQSATLPTATTIAILGGITAIIVYAILEIIKNAAKKGSDFAGKWWYSSVIRLLALILGGLIGFLLFAPLGGPGSGWPIGAAIGASAGALDAFVYRLVKKRLKNATQTSTNSQ